MDWFDAIMLISIIIFFLLILIKILDNIINSFFMINGFQSNSSLLCYSVKFILHFLFFQVKKHYFIQKIFVLLFTEYTLSDFINSVFEFNCKLAIESFFHNIVDSTSSVVLFRANQNLSYINFNYQNNVFDNDYKSKEGSKSFKWFVISSCVSTEYT
jgi:hypothetical protein